MSLRLLLVVELISNPCQIQSYKRHIMYDSNRLVKDFIKHKERKKKTSSVLVSVYPGQTVSLFRSLSSKENQKRRIKKLSKFISVCFL